MTSYEFEKAAKNAVIDALAKRGIEASIQDLEFVWFSHLIGSKKCLIYGEVMANLYAEVTYSRYSDVMYVDLYQKLDHIELYSHEIKFDSGVDKLL